MLKPKVQLSLLAEDFYNRYQRHKQVAFFTLGCKVNQYETDAMEHLFRDSGYEVTDFESFADVYVINTCTVTSMSDKKSRQMIRRAKKHNENAIIAVVGCYSQKSPDEVIAIEGVNLVMGTSDRNKIVTEVEKLDVKDHVIEVEDIMKQRVFEALSIEETYGKTRAFLKIQEGCDRFCSYCIIPYTRGPVRSRPINDIISEVKSLAKNGYKEVVLTGIHVASYGKDLGDIRLIDVIKAINDIDGIHRIRTSSVEPLIITDDFLSELKEIDKFCPHFHLSLQSGSDSVLERMNRRYDKAEYKSAVDKIRKIYPDAAITTDIIVGFPGESDAEFEETRAYLEDINLYEMHIFKFSPREGTKAAAMDNQVKPEIKNHRSEVLIELAEKNKLEFEEKLVGKEAEVLFESSENGIYEGHTMNYVKVHVQSDMDLIGEIARVNIDRLENKKIYGKIIQNEI